MNDCMIAAIVVASCCTANIITGCLFTYCLHNHVPEYERNAVVPTPKSFTKAPLVIDNISCVLLEHPTGETAIGFRMGDMDPCKREKVRKYVLDGKV